MKTERSRLEQMAQKPPRFNLWFWKEFLANCLKALIIHWLLTNHQDDGIVWGIWLDHEGLHVGDFWGTMIMIWLAKNIYISIRRTWPWL